MKQWFAFIFTSFFLMGIASGVNAYPGMQAAAEQTTDSTLERINILPQPFPVALVDFSDIVGEPVNFDQYKGKVVVINLDVFPLDTIPATFILNEQGELVAYVRSYVDWDDKNVISFLEQFRKGTKKVQ